MVTEKMVEALKPFADLAECYDPQEGDDDQKCWHDGGTPKIGDLRRARSALEAALSTDAEPEPICNLVWKQYYRAADDIEDYFEVARPGDKCVDGSDPFPVYVAPRTPALGAGLTLSDLQSAHVERQEEWCPDVKPDLSFRGNELGGECGEAQNVIKKLERERHGWRGSRDTVEHLAEELADVIHCTMLVAITAGIDLQQSVVSKFNDTSKKNGLSTMLAAAPAAKLEG